MALQRKRRFGKIKRLAESGRRILKSVRISEHRRALSGNPHAAIFTIPLGVYFFSVICVRIYSATQSNAYCSKRPVETNVFFARRIDAAIHRTEEQVCVIAEADLGCAIAERDARHCTNIRYRHHARTTMGMGTSIVGGMIEKIQEGNIDPRVENAFRFIEPL